MPPKGKKPFGKKPQQAIDAAKKVEEDEQQVVATSSSPSTTTTQKINSNTDSTITSIEVGICNDISTTAKVDPIVCADVFSSDESGNNNNNNGGNDQQQQPALMCVAHESGRLTQYILLDSSNKQSHITPMCWTGGKEDLVFSRLRYITWSSNTNSNNNNNASSSILCIAAATRAGQILLFSADTLHLITTIQSGGGSIQDLSETVRFSDQDKSSIFAACADGGIRRFTASIDEYGMRTSATSNLFSSSSNNTEGIDTSFNHNDKDSAIFGALSLEVDQQFTRHEKASLALAVSASSNAGLVCFTDDIGNITAHRISDDRKKRDFGWTLQLPTGVGLRVSIVNDSSSNTVVVGTSVNEVVFIDSLLGVFGQRFRHHQAPVTALCTSYNALANSTSLYASGWHDLIRAYACPSHRIQQLREDASSSGNGRNNVSLAYDFAPAEAKRQSHYHEVVELFASRGFLFSFSKDGTIMQVPLKSINEPNKAVYTDTMNNKTAPCAMQGPIVCFFNDTSFEVQFFAIRPTAITALGTLQLRRPWRVRSMTLSRNLQNLAVTTDVGVSIFKLSIDIAINKIRSIHRHYTSYLCTEEVLSAKLKLEMGSRKHRNNRKTAHYVSRIMGQNRFEIPEATSVSFSENACYISSGRCVYRVRLQRKKDVAAQQQQEQEQQQGRRRQREENKDEEKEKTAEELESHAFEIVSRHSFNKRVSFVSVFGKAAGGSSQQNQQQTLFVVFTDGTSQLILLNPHESVNGGEALNSIENFISPTTGKKLSVTDAVVTLGRKFPIGGENNKNNNQKFTTARSVREGPRGIFTAPVLPNHESSFDDELVCYSVEARSHLVLCAAEADGQNFHLPARPISSFAPSTFNFEAKLTNNNGDDVNSSNTNNEQHQQYVTTSSSGLQMVESASNGRFRQLNNKLSNVNIHNNDKQQKPQDGTKLRPAHVEFLFPENWKKQTFTRGQKNGNIANNNNDDDDGNDNNKDTALTEQERRESIAAQALSSVAVATVGDIAAANSLEDLKQEKQSRTKMMQSRPSMIVFDRNLERMIASLPPMWRIRKFGN